MNSSGSASTNQIHLQHLKGGHVERESLPQEGMITRGHSCASETAACRVKPAKRETVVDPGSPETT